MGHKRCGPRAGRWIMPRNKVSKSIVKSLLDQYGFTKSELFITIGNTCFSENGKPKNRAQ